jgi:hypothetical protein
VEPTGTKRENLRTPQGLKARYVIARPAGPGTTKGLFSRSVGPAQIALTKNENQAETDKNKPKRTGTHRNGWGDIICGMAYHHPMQRCNHPTIQRPSAKIG